jgi:putative transposase
MTKEKEVSMFDDEMLDEVLKGCKTEKDLFGEKGVVKQFVKRLAERALKGELTHHLGYEKHDPTGYNSGDSRNGSSKKTIKGEFGEAEIEVPRDRNGDFEPRFIGKGQTRFTGFDDKIMAMYARGLSTRDIQSQLQEIYGVEVSPGLISAVTDEVLEDVKAWQNRPLDNVYPIVYLDCLVVKIKQNNQVTNKAVYLALAINMEGQKELLGMWISQNEGAKFWLGVLTELKNRGVKDILIACVDGLTGFPEAIEHVYPKTQTQLCIVHMIRNSLKYVSYKERKELAQDLKTIYTAATADEARSNLETFGKKWDHRYPTVSRSWYSHWENITPFFAFPSDLRKVIYTTNAIESLNMTLRKVIKNKRSFPDDDSAIKLLYLAVNNAAKKWTMPVRDWGTALGVLAIMFEGRLPI